MSYVEAHLLPGERIVHRAHLHRIIYVIPTLITLALQGVAAWAFVQEQLALGVGVLAVGLLPVLWAWIDYTSSEFAVTDKRVIIKVGFIQRRTMEIMLEQVEAVGVDQTLFGRMLDYGTITVAGTGETQEKFMNIASPLEFRRQVHGAIAAADEPPALAGHATARDERECPHCAELVLKKARVCKHCGRDI